MRSVQDIKADLTEAIAKRDAWEIDTDDDDVIQAFEDMLDEVHGSFMGYAASTILKEVDPTAFRCGVNDYADSLDKESFADYRELVEAVEALDDERADAEDVDGESWGIA